MGSSTASFRFSKGLMTELKDKNHALTRGSNSRQILASFPGGGRGNGKMATSIHCTGCSLPMGPAKGLGRLKAGWHAAHQTPDPSAGCFGTTQVSFSMSHKVLSITNLSTRRTDCLEEESASNLHKGNDGLVVALERKGTFP